MNISGLWKYDELKKQYNAVAAELDTVKKTATQLTTENYYLKRDSEDTWKIWDNYNPDYKDMINPKKNRN